MATDTNSSTLIIAPRPGHQLACRNIRLGLPVPLGHRHPGLAWYVQRRRNQVDRQFHALGRLGIGRSYHQRAVLISGLWPTPARPAPCSCCGQLNPKVMAEHYCQICLDYFQRSGFLLPDPGRFPLARPRPTHRPRIARPFRVPGVNLLIRSRQRPRATLPRMGIYISWWHRPLTRFVYSRSVAIYLHRKRSLARKARQRGLVPVKPGIWYDQVADVAYVQSAVGLETIEQVRFGGAK